MDAASADPCGQSQEQIRGAHDVLVTAVSLAAFRQAIGMLRRGGTWFLMASFLVSSLSPSSTWLVINGYALKGSIVGTRSDLDEALAFAAEGKVRAMIYQYQKVANT
ncbi:MAG: hypothetical protein WB630_03645 [Candidatus Acidiferrales bacterium]